MIVTKDWAGIVWAAVPGHEGYFASAQGQILSTMGKEPRILRELRYKRDYRFVFLYDFGSHHRTKAYVHRIVRGAWDGIDAEAYPLDCRHLDDDKGNNRLENLAWGDRFQNMADAIRNGLIQFGEARPQHKLTEAQAREIRAQRGKEPYSAIARRYGIAASTARRIALGVKWKYLDNTKEGRT